MRDFAIDLARRAGALLRDFHHEAETSHAFDTKSSPVDLVTAADVASDKLISDALRAAFPAHSIHSEESAAGPLPQAEWLWVIDPLDGTTNFAHRVPFFGVNIALAHHGVTVLGVTFEPLTDHLFWAEQGRGAWLRKDGAEQRLRVSPTTELSRSLLTTGFPTDRRTNPDNNLAEFNALERRSHGVRRQGSAALELAWVAAGIVEAFWHPRLKPWDAAPGWLLIQEAGGRVTEYDGRPWRLDSPTMIASNGQPGVHDAILETIAAARATLQVSGTGRADRAG
jgi:myo-inositol-1(or 4)-monophosphatase